MADSHFTKEMPFEGGSLYLGALCLGKGPEKDLEESLSKAIGGIKLIHNAFPEGGVLEITLGPFEGGIRLSDRVFAPLFITDKGLKCEVEGSRVTQFQLGQTLALRGPCFIQEDKEGESNKKILGFEVTFLLKEGSARFVGRIAVGNREDPKGKVKEVKRGLDRMIFLEALEPFERAKLHLEIKAIRSL